MNKCLRVKLPWQSVLEQLPNGSVQAHACFYKLFIWSNNSFKVRPSMSSSKAFVVSVRLEVCLCRVMEADCLCEARQHLQSLMEFFRSESTPALIHRSVRPSLPSDLQPTRSWSFVWKRRPECFYRSWKCFWYKPLRYFIEATAEKVLKKSCGPRQYASHLKGFFSELRSVFKRLNVFKITHKLTFVENPK